MARWFRYYRKRRYYRRSRRRSAYIRNKRNIARSKAMSKTNIVKVEGVQTMTTPSIGSTGNGGTLSQMSLSSFLINNTAFKQLSNVYDQFKVVSARFQVSIVNTTAAGNFSCCGAYDKTGFASGINFVNLQTYASYKIGKCVNPATDCPLMTYYLPRGAIETSQWFDTKDLSKLIPTLAFGAAGYASTAGTFGLSVTATLMLAFRGTRVDTTAPKGMN